MSSVCPCQILNFEYLLKIFSTTYTCLHKTTANTIDIQHVRIFEMLRSLTKKNLSNDDGEFKASSIDFGKLLESPG
jgi:hypothetical protein